MRDAQSQVLGAYTRLHCHVSSVFAAKTLAFFSAVDFARDSGLSQLVFEGDSLHVIRKLSNPLDDRSEIRALIIEGKMRLLTSFAVATIYHYYREQKQVTHQLAVPGFRWQTDRF